MIQKFDTPEALAKSYIALEKRFGVPGDRLLTLPDKPLDEDPAAYADIFKRLGAVEKAEDYGLQLPETSTDADKAIFSSLSGVLVENKILPAQAKALISWWAAEGERRAEQDKAFVAELDRSNTDALKKEFGAAYDPTMKAIDNVLEKYFGKETRDFMDAAQLKNDPKFARGFAKLIEAMAEPGTPGAGASPDPASDVLSPTRAKGELNRLAGDKEFNAKLFNKSHPEHKWAVQRRSQLTAWAEGREV